MAAEDSANVDPSLLFLHGGDVRSRNQARLAEILAEHGWPGKSLVGEDGARAAWLIAQHADLDPALQQRCLELLREAFRWREAGVSELAYLTDRILRNAHEAQMYGTQGVGATSPADEARIDANRKAIGLEPWRSYVEKLKERAQGR